MHAMWVMLEFVSGPRDVKHHAGSFTHIVSQNTSEFRVRQEGPQ